MLYGECLCVMQQMGITMVISARLSHPLHVQKAPAIKASCVLCLAVLAQAGAHLQL